MAELTVNDVRSLIRRELLTAYIGANSLLPNKIQVGSGTASDNILGNDGTYTKWMSAAALGLATSSGYATLSDMYMAQDMALEAYQHADELDALMDRKVEFELAEKADRLHRHHAAEIGYNALYSVAGVISALDTFTAGLDAAITVLDDSLTVLTDDFAAHLADTSDAHDASAVSVLDSLGLITGTDVEAALAEIVQRQLVSRLSEDLYARELAQDALKDVHCLEKRLDRKIDFELDQKADRNDTYRLQASKLGGIKMGTYTTATTTGNDSITGLGFRPRLILTFGGVLGDSTNTSHISIGATDGTTQFAIATSQSVAGPTATKNVESDAFFLSIATGTPGAIIKEFSIVSFDAGGFTFNRVTNDANVYTMAYIAIG